MLLEKLIKEAEIIEYDNLDLSKLKGEIKYGSNISIKWHGRTFIDKGYVLQTPEQDEDLEMYDFFIHVPSPDNEEGIGDAPPVWVHIKSLLINDMVSWVKFTKGIN